MTCMVRGPLSLDLFRARAHVLPPLLTHTGKVSIMLHLPVPCEFKHREVGLQC